MLILFVSVYIYSIRGCGLHCGLDKNTVDLKKHLLLDTYCVVGPTLLAQPTIRIRKLQTSKPKASPRARHYHVCLSTGCALGGPRSLVRQEEESVKRGNKEYILVCSQDDTHATKLFP